MGEPINNFFSKGDIKMVTARSSSPQAQAYKDGYESASLGLDLSIPGHLTSEEKESFVKGYKNWGKHNSNNS